MVWQKTCDGAPGFRMTASNRQKNRHEPGLRNRLVEGGVRTLGRYSEEEIMRGIIGMYRELKIEN